MKKQLNIRSKIDATEFWTVCIVSTNNNYNVTCESNICGYQIKIFKLVDIYENVDSLAYTTLQLSIKAAQIEYKKVFLIS